MRVVIPLDTEGAAAEATFLLRTLDLVIVLAVPS